MYSHKHVLWTAQFFQDFEAHLKQYLTFSSDFSYGQLMNLAAKHHHPSTFSERLIQKADHYSSGSDRSQSDEAWKDAQEEDDKNWDAFKRIQMRSVFDGISLNGIKNDVGHKATH